MIDEELEDLGEFSSLSNLRLRAAKGLPIPGAAHGDPAKFASDTSAATAERLYRAHSSSLRS